VAKRENFTLGAIERVVLPPFQSLPLTLDKSGAPRGLFWFIQVPTNEQWGLVAFSALFEVDVIADCVLDDQHVFITSGNDTMRMIANMSSGVASNPAPAGRFIITPSYRVQELGSGRTFGIATTVHNTNAGADRAITVATMSADIVRTRLVPGG